MKRYYVLSFIAGALSMFVALAIIATVIMPNRLEEQKEYEHIIHMGRKECCNPKHELFQDAEIGNKPI